jgi:putative salt-induced outer membrane protein YdiY
VKLLALALCGVVLVCHAPARADEIQFTNGDRLTGKLTRLKDGKLAFESKVAGTLALNWADIATLSTDDPVTLQLEGGSVIVDKLVAAQPGSVTTAGNDKVSAQTIPLASAVKVNPEPVHWAGNLVAGADIERGNTVKTAANAKLDAVRRSDIDRITFGAYYNGEQTGANGSNDQNTTTRKLGGLLQYDYFVSKQFYTYGNAAGDKDGVANLDLRFTAGAGLGYQWFETDTFKWGTEAGLSWVSENYSNAPTNDYIALRFASNLEYVLYSGLTFFQKTQFYPSLEHWEDQLLITSTGLRYKLFGNFFGESRVDWTWDRTPAPGKKENDLAFILGIGYGF